jgi:hypothetical protein
VRTAPLYEICPQYVHVESAYLKENADAEVHERLREVYDALPGIVYGHRSHRQIRLLRSK